MAVKLTIIKIQETLESTTLICGLTFTGNYPVGGDTIDFTTIAGQGDNYGRIFTPSNPCLEGQITGTFGYTYGFIPGSLLNNNLVTINSAPNTPIAGAYAAGVSTDLNIVAEFNFPKSL